MNFSSFQYYIFLPVVVFLYFLTRPKWRNILLLAFSYYFYMCWNPKYALLILTSTVITYGCGVFIQKDRGRKKTYLVLSLIINLAILFFFKYFNFVSGLIEDVLHVAGVGVTMPYLNILLPVGISFYTFQALGYTMDVYRGHLPAEENFITYALFVSFFPQLVAGPIERSGNLLPQLKTTHKFTYANVKAGLVLILWGLFKKVVVADRLAVLANTVYTPGEDLFSGMQYIIATVAFAFQIYCDFSAYSDIARGSARMLDIHLMRNFNAPYFARSIKDFWRRWHISLSTWFKDYLYFPLGGSRCSTARNCFNLMVVFTISGLWHGAALTFVIWGFLNGLYQIIPVMCRPAIKALGGKIPISGKNPFVAAFQCLVTFALTCFAWIFFRAESISQALGIVGRIFEDMAAGRIFPLKLTEMGLSRPYFIAGFMAAGLLLAVDFISQYKDIPAWINKSRGLEYTTFFILIGLILVFGYYGMGYDPQDFIYFQF